MAKIAVVIADDYEDSEFEHPAEALSAAGHDLTLIGKEAGTVTGKRGGKADVDVAVGDTSPDDYDALLIPGGFAPDRLRTDSAIVSFVSSIDDAGKPIAAICHAPSLLIEAEVVDGKRMTSFQSIRTDLRNAGADVVDEPVVVDGRLITSRTPDDLEPFTEAFLAQLDA